MIRCISVNRSNHLIALHTTFDSNILTQTFPQDCRYCTETRTAEVYERLVLPALYSLHTVHSCVL